MIKPFYGAAAGAVVGGGIGGGVAAAEFDDNWYGIPAGIIGGAIIGGIIGYLMAPPPPPPQPPPPPPEKIILRGVHFDFDKANIRPQDAAVLDEAAETLKSHPNLTIAVNGYCDAIGSVRYNPRLSSAAPMAVVKYLADHGVAESRMTPHGYGKTNFVPRTRRATAAPRTAGSSWYRTNRRLSEQVPTSAGVMIFICAGLRVSLRRDSTGGRATYCPSMTLPLRIFLSLACTARFSI